MGPLPYTHHTHTLTARNTKKVGSGGPFENRGSGEGIRKEHTDTYQNLLQFCLLMHQVQLFVGWTTPMKCSLSLDPTPGIPFLHAHTQDKFLLFGSLVGGGGEGQKAPPLTASSSSFFFFLAPEGSF